MWQELLVAVVVLYILSRVFMREGMENPDSRVRNPCPSGFEQCPSGDCRLASEVHSFCN